jgi:glycosyltransferase involved in cell wall biosynthesis
MWRLFEEKYDLDSSKYIDHCLFQQERERMEWKYANKIIVPSNYVKNELIKDGGVDVNKVNVVNYGYTPTKDKDVIHRAIENKTSQKGKKINLIFVGNTGYRKGIADLIKLAELLKDENINFLIAGKMEEEASKMIKEHKYENVIYLGKLSKEALTEHYLGADIFFFPSYLEGSAMVLQEAMGWGLPIITSYQSGSVAIEGVNGFLCDSGEIETFKSNILKLAYDDNLRYKMSLSSLEMSVNYSVEAYGKSLLKILTE